MSHPKDQLWEVTWIDAKTGKPRSNKVRGGDPRTHLAVVTSNGHKKCKVVSIKG